MFESRVNLTRLKKSVVSFKEKSIEKIFITDILKDIL